MTSPIKKVTLISGSGRLGPYLLSALQPTYDLTVITRASSRATFPNSTKVIRVSDSYPIDELTSVLRGQDALVLCVGYLCSPDEEFKLIDASIKAGVRRCILNEYGANYQDERTHVGAISGLKADMRTRILERAGQADAKGWSWTGVACGMFLDESLRMDGFIFGFSATQRSARIIGSGTTPFSVSNLSLVGTAVARVLSHPDETANRTVYVQSARVTIRQMLALYKKFLGEDGWKVEDVDAEKEIADCKAASEKVGGLAGGVEGIMAEAGVARALTVAYGYGVDFEEVLDNELLGIQEEDPERAFESVLGKTA